MHPNRMLRVPVSPTSDCELLFYGEPSTAAFRKLVLFIELTMEAWGPEGVFPQTFDVMDALMKWRAAYDALAMPDSTKLHVERLQLATAELKGQIDRAVDILLEEK
jgi:hypothetical protein